MGRRGGGFLDQPLKTSLAVRMVAWQQLRTLECVRAESTQHELPVDRGREGSSHVFVMVLSVSADCCGEWL